MSRREPKQRLSAARDYPFDRRNNSADEHVNQDAVVDPVASESDHEAEFIEGHALMCRAERP